MFSNISINLTKEEVEILIRNAVKQETGLEVESVSFQIGQQGGNYHDTYSVFTGAHVKLKSAKGTTPTVLKR